MANPLDIVLLIVNTVNIFLHSLGFHLLWCLKRKCVQEIYLLNLSLTELLKNIVIFLTTVPDVLTLSDNAWVVIDEIHIYIGVVYDYGIMLSYYLTLFYITLDRYLGTALTITYPAYWNVTRTKYLVIITWILAGCICISLSVLYQITGYSRASKIFLYF